MKKYLQIHDIRNCDGFKILVTQTSLKDVIEKKLRLSGKSCVDCSHENHELKLKDGAFSSAFLNLSTMEQI